MKDVQVGAAFETAWRGTKNNFGTYLILVLLLIVAGILQEVAKDAMEGRAFLSLFLVLLSFVGNTILTVIVTKFSLQIAEMNGEKAASFGDLELGLDSIGRFLLTQWLLVAGALLILVAVAAPMAVFVAVNFGLAALKGSADLWRSLGGGILLSVLAVLVALGYYVLTFSMALLASLHQNLGPIDAMLESKRLCGGVKGGLFKAMLLSIGVMFAGLLCLIVGIIPAIMVVSLAQAVIYLSLLEQSGPRMPHA